MEGAPAGCRSPPTLSELQPGWMAASGSRTLHGPSQTAASSLRPTGNPALILQDPSQHRPGHRLPKPPSPEPRVSPPPLHCDCLWGCPSWWWYPACPEQAASQCPRVGSRVPPALPLALVSPVLKTVVSVLPVPEGSEATLIATSQRLISQESWISGEPEA